jgi:type I restriction-modification system DNA methylase subunit
MARPKKNDTKPTANLGFEAKLWLAADKLRNNMDAAEYKHVVLGLIFLKYISDIFEEHRAKLSAGFGDYEGARAKIRVMVKRILNKYGYPPDLQAEAVKTVLMQAELLCKEWAA